MASPAEKAFSMNRCVDIDEIRHLFAELTAKLEDSAARASGGQGVGTASAAAQIAHDLQTAMKDIGNDLDQLQGLLP